MLEEAINDPDYKEYQRRHLQTKEVYELLKEQSATKNVDDKIVDLLNYVNEPLARWNKRWEKIADEFWS